MTQASHKEAQECTVGVIHIPGGILFFKNRDLKRDYVANRLAVRHSTPDFHTLKGINLKTGELAGVAIGVNRHRICVANTHVASTPDVTYDILCERLVQEARRQSDVPTIVKDFMGQHRVQGGRILVASPAWTLLVEVFKDQFAVQDIEGSVAIANAFSLLPPYEDKEEEDKKSSETRLQVANDLIPTISSIQGLKSMLRSHIPEKGKLSICSHWKDGGGTESSHIIQIQGEYVGWSSLVGFPCENDYQTIQLFQTPCLEKSYPDSEYPLDRKPA
jgi:hypothetical protein